MEHREDQPDDAGEKSPDEPVAGRKGRLRLFAGLLMLCSLFAVAWGGSWLYRELTIAAADTEHADNEPPPRIKKHTSELDAAEILGRGDQALSEHRFGDALASYQLLLKVEAGSVALVDYRIGLCNESLGRLGEAQAAYRKTISNEPHPRLTWAAHLGMARCQLRQNHPVEARRLLSPFLLDEKLQEKAPSPLRAGTRYLIALAFAQEMAPTPTTGLENDRPVSLSSIVLEVPFYLDEHGDSGVISNEISKEPGVGPLAPSILLKKNKDPRETLVSNIDETEQPGWKLLDRLALESGLAVDWSPGAKKTLGDRNLHLCVRDWPIVDLLEQAADRFAVVCHFDGNRVRFATASEMHAKDLMLARSATCKRALMAALRSDTLHPWAPAVLFELGNFETTFGQPEMGARWFDRLIRRTGSTPFVAPACYNLALLLSREQQPALAREALFRVIDEAPGHELALRAYLRIAKECLEAENTEEAILHLRRAQAWAPGSPYQPLATLLLAVAHLQRGEPAMTRATLVKDRLILQKDPYKPAAAFLDAFAQYRFASGGARREATDLLSTLGPELNDALLGAVGTRLIAQAYVELGFLNQAEQQLRRVLSQIKGPFVPVLEFQLAEVLLAQDRRSEAQPLFEKLADSHSRYHARAAFQMVRFDLQDKNYSACIERCRQLWDEGAVAESAKLLHTWGMALEATGDFAKAAQCFAGKAPE